ncbi:probable Kelch-like protein 20 at C-terminar half [Coccomyxa sp. Obi]|nr:probable Kelch-like protein 20 at C-terminar half [Coccomyxa sp. Obi]
MTSTAKAEVAVTLALLRAPQQTLSLPLVGLLLRKQGYQHQVGLKTWLLERPELFIVNSNDTVTAILRPSLDTEVGELALEIKLVEFLKTFRRPAHLGTNVWRTNGVHCTKVLNINTSGRLKDFLQSRPNLFQCDGYYVSLVNAPGNVRQPAATPKLPDPIEQGPTEDASHDIPPGFQAPTNPGIFTVRLPNAREPSQNGTFADSSPVRAVPAQRPSSSIATLQKPKIFAAVPPAKRVNGIAHVAVPAQRVTSVAKMPQPNGVAVRPNREQTGVAQNAAHVAVPAQSVSSAANMPQPKVVAARPNTEQSGVVQRAVPPKRSISPATPEQPHVVALQQWRKLSSVGQSAAAAQKPTSVVSQQQSVQSTTLPEDTPKAEASQSQEINALKAQVEELKIAVDAIRHHLNLPQSAPPAAIAATAVDCPAQKTQAVTAGSATEGVSLPSASSGGIAEDVSMSGQHLEEKRAGASSSDQEANSDTSDLQKLLEDYDLQICVCGGHDSEQWLATTDQFDLSKKSWKKLAELDVPTSFAAAGSIYNHIYLFGGSDGTKWSSGVKRYVVNGNEEDGDDEDGWSTVAPMSKIRGSLACSRIGGTFYAIGGGIPSEQYTLVEGYDPITDRWRILPHGLQTSRFALASSVVKGSIVCVGGLHGTQYLDTAESFDPREGRWKTLSGRMSSRRGNLGLCTLGETSVLAMGGFNGTKSVESCEVLDLRSGKWRPAAPMAAGRAFGAGIAVNSDQALAFGGLASNMHNYNTTMEMYSLKEDTWIEFLPSEKPGSLMRAFFTAAAVEA